MKLRLYQPEPSKPTYWRTTDNVNIRSGPGTEHETLTPRPLASGTLLQVHGQRDGWLQVTTNGTNGWVSADYATQLPADEAAAAGRDFEQLQQAAGYYINQVDAEGDVGLDQQKNHNCGPTSLAIALRQQGLTLPAIEGVPDNGTPGAEVQRTRYAMYHGHDDSMDGVTAGPDGALQYSDAENTSDTGPTGLKRGIEAAGGKWTTLGDTDEIVSALNAGKTVIVSGSFVDLDANGVPTTTERSDVWERGGGATRHIVAITGVTSDGGFIVDDPIYERRGPVVVTRDQLETFMAGNWSALSVEPKPLSHWEARRLLS
jgi:hypothetical protein